MVFNEWFGELTDAQWRAYRRHNISPADHDGWVATSWSPDIIARWMCTVADLGVVPDGSHGPMWAQRWHVAGFTADVVANLVLEVVVATGRSAHDVLPDDVNRAGVTRQPSLFEQLGSVG